MFSGSAKGRAVKVTNVFTDKSEILNSGGLIILMYNSRFDNIMDWDLTWEPVLCLYLQDKLAMG